MGALWERPLGESWGNAGASGPQTRLSPGAQQGLIELLYNL
eukprot:COSAG02_NODE_65141_length_258_cov_2.220126_1_plen_40_part_10